jgi:stage III sporulation protein AC
MELDVSLILKIVGVGVLVAVSSSILSKTGRDEQAMFVTLAGIITVMLMLVGEIGALFDTVRSTFGF